ncbi:MAG: hypothetical protein AAFX87_29500 [Bacteroidota bacterium]
MKKILTIGFVFLALQGMAQDMDLKKLKLALAKKAIIKEESGSMIQYELDEIQIYLITDENNNRMRLMAGVVEESKLSKDDLTTLMKANFDRALDAKYALANGVLWSVFAHPLKELEESQAVDALYQVKNLVINYGSSYTSTDFVFGGGE